MNFITTHPIALLVAAISIAMLVCILRNTGTHDKPVSIIEPQDLMDYEHPCSWCQKEQAIKAQPHESHGICKRHAAMLLADARRINRAA